ncbi:MAG TPA: MarR family transcriptional regulator [Thermoplasmata archaeon]|jgi:CRISPR locus-related DNA-binding protein
MVAVFGTLGFRPKSLIPTIRSTADVDEVVVYCGSDKADPGSAKKVAEARRSVVEYCRNLRIAIEVVDLEDPFDFRSIALRIRADVRKRKQAGKDIGVFNIAGGTRPTSSAALLVCMLEGIPTVYVHDVTYQEIRLPLLRMEYSQVLSGMERTILGILVNNKGGDLTEVELAKLVGKHKATVNHHLRNLVKKGAVRLERHPKDSRKKIVRLEESTELLLGEA